MYSLAIGAGICVVFLALNLISWLHRISISPPGPTGLPLVGNILQAPTDYTWRYFAQLSRIYGSIIRLTMGKDDILVLTDPKDADELLGRRSAIYSSRKPLVYSGKYQSNNMRIVLLPYGDSLKKQRAAFHQMLQPRVVGGYESMQEVESVKLLYEMLARPSDYSRNCQRYAASLVFYLSYGKRLADDDEDLRGIADILNNFLIHTTPGVHLVDLFPVLDRLPDMLAPWRAEARQRHVVELNFYQRLARDVKKTVDGGRTDLECFAARLWDQQEKLNLSVEELSFLAGSAFEAGTDTTSVTILWFIMAMVLYPDTAIKAQNEIDALLGDDGSTIPGFDHMDGLPYCFALVKEVLRWGPAAPNAFPHYLDSDDEYKGYKIKANTMVIPCVWAMNRNVDEFPMPEKFDPERYMKADNPQERSSLTEGHYSFGFGRRRCPGQYLGSKTVWLAITRMLWAFNMRPACDAYGNVAKVDPRNCSPGVISRPLDYPLDLSVRSQNHASTIMRLWSAQK